MSAVKWEDYFQNPEGFDVGDTFRQLKKDLDDMELPESLGLENPGLMSSEFFDSVLSLEEQTKFFQHGQNSDNISSSNGDSDFALNSEPEELCLNYTNSPDSASSGFSYELGDFSCTKNNVTPGKSNIILVKKPQQEITKLIKPPIQVPGKIIVNNPNGKKVIVTKPYVKNNRRNMTNTKRIFKVQSISGNGRSLFLPFNVTKMKNVKIINGKELCLENLEVIKSPNVPSLKYEDSYSASSPETIDDDSDSFDAKSSSQYPLLVLTDEEKRLLVKEGVRLPTHYPLTKFEEKELKRIRRKIRNKISAQDSRKRKKEYVDGLEARLKQSAEEKKLLMSRVKVLQQQNNKLISQMHKLQTLVFNTNKVTPTTCLLIVLMSALLVSLPNLNITKGQNIKDEQQAIARRSLLSSQLATNEDNGSLDEFLLFNRNHKSKISAIDEEVVIEEHDAPAYLNYDDADECENHHQKSRLKSTDIVKDIHNTLDKMKDFFKNQFDFNGNYNEGEMIETHDVPINCPKRVRFCSDMYDDYSSTKKTKLSCNDDVEDYINGELNTSDTPSTVSLHLANRE